MRRIVPLILLGLCGCLGSIGTSNKKSPEPPPSPHQNPPVIDQKPKPVDPQMVESTVTIGMPSSILGLIAPYLGKNTITLSQSMTIKAEDTTLAIPAGANISYALTAERGEFLFNSPRPVLTMIKFGVPIHPVLTKIVLLPDDTAVATGNWHGFEEEKVIDLRPKKNAGTSEPTPLPPVEIHPEPDLDFLNQTVKPKLDQPKKILPEVWMLVNSGDESNRAYQELLDHPEDLPFQIVVIRNVPEWLKPSLENHYPSFYFPIDCDFVSCGKTFRILYSYKSVKTLIHEWTEARNSLKKRVASVSEQKVKFGSPWYEVDHRGRKHNTSAQHLLSDHLVPQWVVDKHRGNPDALNRIHGYAHEHGGIY